MPTDPTLLSKMAVHLDKHLLLPVLRFAEEKAASADVKSQYTSAIASVTAQTSIPTDSTSDEQKAELEKTYAKHLKAAGALIDLYFNNSDELGLRLKFVGKDFSDALRSGKFGAGELKTAGVKPKNVRALYDVAFMLVESGQYAAASDVLKVHNVITTPDASDADEETNARNCSALWGRYMCDVLEGRVDSAKMGLDQLLQLLDDRAADEANTARCTLLHWSLFFYFKRRDPTALLDLLFMYDRADRTKTFLYSNVVQCLAPHLMRYVAVAAVLGKKKKSTLNRAARVLDSDSYQYSDVFTRFVVELCINTDFVKATQLLAECDAELANDYFCCDLRADFVANARQLLFEDQLRVRKCLSIDSAAAQLGMTRDRAELWLVDLIRGAKLDATVDSVAGSVRVNGVTSQKSVWQHVLDRLEHATGIKAPVTA